MKKSVRRFSACILAIIMMIAFMPSAVNVDAQASAATVTDNIEITLSDKNGDLLALEGAKITVSSGGRILNSDILTNADGIADYKRVYRDSLDYTVSLPKADYDFDVMDKHMVFKGSSEYHRWRLISPHYIPKSFAWNIHDFKMLEEDGMYKLSFTAKNAPLAWGKTFIKINLKEKEYYTASFDVNGGNEQIDSQSVAKGESVKEPPVPTREGYDFVEWQLDGNSYDFNYGLWNNITLKAVWKKIEILPNKYTVSFDLAGGTNDIASQIVEEGKRAYRPLSPVKDGYRFVQWELDGKRYEFYEPVMKDIVLVARWEKVVPRYFVSFDVAGGDHSVSTQIVKEGLRAYEPSEPRREGYDFVEWQLNGQSFDFSSEIVADITLKAVWEKIEEEPEPKKYTVKFDVNGGNESIASQIVEENHTVRRPAEPSKDGCEFVEWQVDGVEYEFYTRVTKDITIVAVWEEVGDTEPVYAISTTKSVDEVEKTLEGEEVKFNFTVEVKNTGTRNLIGVEVYDEMTSTAGARADLGDYASEDENVHFEKDGNTKEIVIFTKFKDVLKPGETKTFKYSVRVKNIGDYINDAYGCAYYRNKKGISNGHGAIYKYLMIKGEPTSMKLKVLASPPPSPKAGNYLE